MTPFARTSLRLHWCAQRSGRWSTRRRFKSVVEDSIDGRVSGVPNLKITINFRHARTQISDGLMARKPSLVVEPRNPTVISID
jgi:hypothetical protein